MHKIRIFVAAVLCVLFSTALVSCFTGVESTPKITAKDVRKRHATQTPEEAYTADVAGQPTAEWKAGKKWRVTDDRIGLVFQPLRSGVYASGLAGKDIELDSICPVTGITGERETQIVLHAPDGTPLIFRSSVTYDDFMRRKTFDIPFAVEQSLVDNMRALLAGNKYYILVSRRQDAAGRDTAGLRYMPVTVLDVVPGDELRPLRVLFRGDDGKTESLMMTCGSGRTATRNFATLFAFDDPRRRYPTITDPVWDLIKHSRVRQDMTREECRLALGAPDEYTQVPSTGGMVELWKYDNGMYLRFDDGRLSVFRM